MHRPSEPNGSSVLALEVGSVPQPRYDLRAKNVAVVVDEDRRWLVVDCVDGRQLRAPLEWFPALERGTSEQQARYKITGGGWFIHWPELDEDIEVEHLFWGERH